MSFATLRVHLSLAVVALVVATARPAFGADGGVYGKPIYDPDTKSYFELVDLRDKSNPNSDGIAWHGANDTATQMTYGGVQGRLAVVKDIKTHEFLLRNFHPGVQTWIGVRYLCRKQQLEWSDGSYWTPGSFQAWDVNWKQDIYFCAATDHPDEIGPVAYSPVPEFRWIAKGSAKHYPAAFVEFPTGHP